MHGETLYGICLFYYFYGILEDCKNPETLISTPDWRDYTLEEGMVMSNGIMF
jgi:hypothetical protein